MPLRRAGIAGSLRSEEAERAGDGTLTGKASREKVEAIMYGSTALPASEYLHELACELSGRYHEVMRDAWLPAALGLGAGGPTGAPRNRADAVTRVKRAVRALRALEWSGFHLDDARHPAGFREALRGLQELSRQLDQRRGALQQSMSVATERALEIHRYLAAIDSTRIELLRSRTCGRCRGRLLPAEGGLSCIACGWSPGSGRTATAAERAEMTFRRRGPRMTEAHNANRDTQSLALGRTPAERE